MESKAKKILDEVGNGISQESRNAIMSIDFLEKKIVELESEIEKMRKQNAEKPKDVKHDSGSDKRKASETDE